MSKDKSSMQAIFKNASAMLALVITALYCAPLNVLLINVREISIPPSLALAFSWKLALALLVFTVFLSGLLPMDKRRILGAVTISIAALFLLQGNYFVWDYGLFDGGDIDWQAHNVVGIVEITVWLALPILTIRYRDKIWPHMHLLSLLIVLMQVSSLVVQTATGAEFPTKYTTATGVEDPTKATDRGLYDFSDEKNVLIIITDTFGSPTFDEILRKEPLVAEKLNGFTSYSNTLGVSPYTLLSVPTILSSRVYENSRTIQSFMTESLNENSLPAVLRENGFKARVVTMGLYKGYLQWLPSQNTTSVLNKNEGDSQLREYLQLWDVTLFRYAPHYLKMKIYDKHKWLLQDRFLDTANSEDAGNMLFGARVEMMKPTPVHLASRVIHDNFIEQANVDSKSPTFKFIHLFTSHTPYLMDVSGNPISKPQYESIPLETRAFDQNKYALTQTLNMLDKLKALGIYDDTLVIIAADHGSDLKNHTRAGYMRRSHPMLLIKPINGRGNLQYSAAPTSLLDIPRTVSGALGIEAEFSGYAILDGEIPSTRKRNYYYFNWNNQGFWNADHLPELEKYEINGPAEDQGAWKKSCDLLHVENGPASC